MKVDRENLHSKIEEMKKNGYDYLVKITAVDYIKSVQLIYILRNTSALKDEVLEVDLDPSDLYVHTIMNYYKAADWYERELAEMFGVEIKGRKAKRLILAKWDGRGYPLRKNFAWNEPYEKRE